MLNVLKMDVYRLLHTKSSYVMAIVLVVMIFLTTVLVGSVEDMPAVDTDSVQISSDDTIDSGDAANNVGINVTVPTESGEKITVFDEFYGNAQGKALALLIVIFAVLFTTGDISSGYVKNTAGQVRHRWYLVVSKAVCLFVYTLFMLILTIVSQALANRLILGHLEWGDGVIFLHYFLLQFLLHYALVLICMAIAIILKSNVLSMILGVCLCMNMMNIIYGLVDHLIYKITDNNFQMLKYTVTGKMGSLPMNPDGAAAVPAIIVAIAFIAAALLIQSFVFEKRDI